MKKMLAWILTCSMLLGLLTFPAAAEGELTVALDKAEAAAGETVTLNLNLSNNPGLCAFTVYLYYRPEYLTATAMSATADKDGNEHGSSLPAP